MPLEELIAKLWLPTDIQKDLHHFFDNPLTVPLLEATVGLLACTFKSILNAGERLRPCNIKLSLVIPFCAGIGLYVFF
jgi:hypothetical protein